MALDPRIVLLIGAETAVVDESSYAQTLTVVGNAARTTAQFKYGTASLTFDGTGDRITAPDSANWFFGTGDFTVEGWFRFLTKTTSQTLLGQWGSNNATQAWCLYSTGGQLDFRTSNGAGVYQDLLFTWTPTLGQWYHIAADRSGTTLRLYVDGVVVATNAAFSASVIDAALSEPLVLGAIGNVNTFPTFDFNGQMDEVRVTKGLAQYAGAFTPPSGPFPRAPTEAWLSQLPVEVLRGSQPLPDLRLSQLPVEILRGSQPLPALRLSQLPIEVLRGPAPTTAGRLSQLVVETLTLHPPPVPQLTQLVVETLTSTTHSAANPQLTQLVVETLSASSHARLSQLVVEALYRVIPDPRLTQLVVETMTATPVARVPLRATQLLAETLSVLPPAPVAVTQVAAEYLDASLIHEAHVTQLLCELLIIARVNQGCPPVTDFPIDPATGSACATSTFPVD